MAERLRRRQRRRGSVTEAASCRSWSLLLAGQRPASIARGRCAARRSRASPAGRGRARRRSPAASRRARRGNPRRSDSARRRRAAFSSISAAKRRRCSAGVGQLAEAVGELDAAGIELEALGDARVVGLAAGRAPPRRRDIRRGSSAGRGRDCGSIRSTRMRLKMSDQVSSSATRMPAFAPRRRRARSRSPRSVASEVDAGVAGEGLGDGEPLGRGEGVGASRPRQVEASSRRRRAAAAARSASAIVHHRLIGLAGAVPFEHGEFRRVQRRRARGCGRRGRSRRSVVSPAASSFFMANSGEVWR